MPPVTGIQKQRQIRLCRLDRYGKLSKEESRPAIIKNGKKKKSISTSFLEGFLGMFH